MKMDKQVKDSKNITNAIEDTQRLVYSKHYLVKKNEIIGTLEKTPNTIIRTHFNNFYHKIIPLSQ